MLCTLFGYCDVYGDTCLGLQLSSPNFVSRPLNPILGLPATQMIKQNEFGENFVYLDDALCHE